MKMEDDVMSILRVENLLKTYGEKTLFDYISFTVEEKERIGLIGVNGTGKSSLLKVLARIEGKEDGVLIHANQFHIEYLPQEPDLQLDKSVIEQVYDGDSLIMKTMRNYELALLSLEQDPLNENLQNQLSAAQEKMVKAEAWEANTIAKTILTKLGISDFSKKVKYLSGGQQKRVAIAKSLIQPADLLLLDEPTNHLDNETIEWLETYLSQYRGSLMVITHDRYFLNRVTNRIFELDNGQLYQYEGNYELFLEKKAEREREEAKQEDKRQNILRRELAWLQRGAKARTTKQKARKQRIENIQKEGSVKDKGDVDFAIGSTRLGKKVIELENVRHSFEGKSLFSGVEYLLTPGDRLGIIGPNGSGKSTLLNIMANRLIPDSGTIAVGETVKIGYYTQSHEQMDEDMRMLDYIKDVAEVVHTADGSVITAEQMLERFLFPRFMQRTHIRRLSGGERRRLYLLKILMDEPNVLFLDEPTNDLDTQTLAVLEDYLDQFPGVVVTVSHDRYFLDRVVDKLLVFDGRGNVDRFQGSYSDYMETVTHELMRVKQADNDRDVKREEQHAGEKKKPKKLSYKDQKEWEEIEDRIAHLEEKVESIEQEIQNTGSDFDLARELYEEQKQVEDQLEKAMERWEELSVLVEEIEANKNK